MVFRNSSTAFFIFYFPTILDLFFKNQISNVYKMKLNEALELDAPFWHGLKRQSFDNSRDASVVGDVSKQASETSRP